MTLKATAPAPSKELMRPVKVFESVEAKVTPASSCVMPLMTFSCAPAKTMLAPASVPILALRASSLMLDVTDIAPKAFTVPPNTSSVPPEAWVPQGPRSG